MAKAIAHIRSFIQPAVFFIPFTLYFILFATGAAIGYEWLTHQEKIPDTSFSEIFSLLLRVTGWFTATLLVLAFLSVSVPLLYFLWKKGKNSIRFSVSTTAILQAKDANQQQRITIQISPLLKPFLGFVKLRLRYDTKNFTDKFSLIGHNRKKIFTLDYEGEYTWSLPEIKEYHIERLVLYFEDFFQFFSFTVGMAVRSRFYAPPLTRYAKDLFVSPRKTEETATRIEELKRVEGEFLNYKNFDDNDDVRRIVWKIYAKNKELVVRIPEVLDPYASHAYMYASFFASLEISGNKTAEIFFLNYYKNMLWAIYEKLIQQGFEVRYIADQQSSLVQFTSEKQSVQYSITTGKWQTIKDLKSYVKPKEASVLVITSLTDAGQAEELLEAADGNTFFILIRLSRSLDKSYWISLLQWLFIQQEKNELEVYKTNWRLSLLRPQVTRNEKKLELLFSRYNKTLVI